MAATKWSAGRAYESFILNTLFTERKIQLLKTNKCFSKYTNGELNHSCYLVHQLFL